MTEENTEPVVEPVVEPVADTPPAVEPKEPVAEPKDEAFYQNAYQKAMTQIKTYSPSLHDRVKDDLKADRGKSPVVDDSRPEEKLIADETVAEFDARMKRHLDQRDADLRADNALQRSYDNTINTLYQAAKDYKLTDTEMTQAKVRVEEMFPNMVPQKGGDPEDWGKLIVLEMDRLAITNNAAARVGKAERVATEKARSVATQQTPAASAQEPAKELSRADELLAEMNKVKPKGSEGLFDSAKR